MTPKTAPIDVVRENGGLSLINGHVEWKGKRVRLSAKRLELVVVLSRNPGRTFTYEDLRQAVFGDEAMTVDAVRRRLRQLVYMTTAEFEDADRTFRGIESVYGIGYRWRAGA